MCYFVIEITYVFNYICNFYDIFEHMMEERVPLLNFNL